MKRSDIHRTLSAALTGLAFAAATQVSGAASDFASETQSAQTSEAASFTATTAIAEPRRTGRGSPLTLYVEDTSGNAFSLVRVPGTGWKYADGRRAAARGRGWLFLKTAFGSKTTAPIANAAVPDEEPLTVFIDGPSGFAYVWTREGGWKFVGTIVDGTP